VYIIYEVDIKYFEDLFKLKISFEIHNIIQNTLFSHYWLFFFKEHYWL